MNERLVRNHAIDGLRGYAILLIVASHCDFLKQGGVGNAIFFTLSGFFSIYPFKKGETEKSLLTLKGVFDYYFGRLCRIIPVFYMVLFFVYFFMKGFLGYEDLLKNMFFVESFGHLWFLQQEMLMYFCVPFIILLMYAIKEIVPVKYNEIACAIILLLLAFLSSNYLTVDKFWLMGNGEKCQIRLYQFFIGMAAGYLYKGYLVSGLEWSKKLWVRLFSNGYNLLFFSFCIVSSSDVLKLWKPELEGYHIGWEQPSICSLLAALCILMLLIGNESIVVRFIGNQILVFIGKISFSIYLVHFFIIGYFGLRYTISNMIMAIILSIGVAIILYYIVEKPSIVFSKTKSIKSVIQYYKELL